MRLCLALVSEPGGEKSPRFLVILPPPLDGENCTGLFFVYAAQFLRWGFFLSAKKKENFKKGIWGSAPSNVLGGQPGALLALPKAGIYRNPYRDTVKMALR